MLDLVAKSPCAGLLPLTIGGVSLREVDAGTLTAFAPHRGKAKAFASAFKKAYGLEVPAVNRSTETESTRAIWFGRGHILLVGPAADAGLAAQAALTDQSDAWSVVVLDGAGAADVLARLTPLDLRDSVFAVGHTARSELMHMSSSITRIAENAWQIMVFRSMAGTLVHDLKSAMEGVAARRG